MDPIFIGQSAAAWAEGQRRARRAVHTAWAGRCEALLDRYFDNGEYEQTLKERLRRLYPNNADQMVENLLTLNVVRKVVDTKAKLYRRPPRRWLLDAEAAALPPDHGGHRIFADLVRATRLNTRMKWLLRTRELLGAAVLWGQIDGRRRVPVLTVLPPHQLVVEQHPDYPGSLADAVSIAVPVGGAADSPLSAAEAVGYVRYRFTSDAQGPRRLVVERLDADFVPWPEQPPELGVYAGLPEYPFVLFRKGETFGSELFPDVPRSLLLMAQWLDHELTRGALNSRQTDFPAYVFNGSAEELGAANPATGAGAVICLNDEEKHLESLAVDPREKERNQNLLFMLKLFAQMNDLSPSAFTFDVELLSGTAKFHDKQPEIEYREDLIDQLTPVEEDAVWPMMRQLARLAGFPGADLLESCRLSVDFPQQVIPLSREEELKNLAREIGLGLRSAADELVDRYGIEPEEARRRVTENLRLSTSAETTGGS